MNDFSNRKLVYVYSHKPGESAPDFMGTLHIAEVRGKEIISFEYDSGFLESGNAINVDPNLRLFPGTQYAPNESANFGIFLDSSPDRWGRVLLDRREGQLARQGERAAKKLLESDYLLGVFDGTRTGAIRFKTEIEGPFKDNNLEHSTPPFATLRELEHASRVYEDDDLFDSEEYRQKLDLLFVPGSSLGGARPKANVKDENESLWIAKFPSLKDNINHGAWEFIVYKMAIRCGINMSISKAEKFYTDHHTFLTKRFDRDDNGNRVHFFSAMTLLGHQDGMDASSGASYLELADLILRRGSRVDEDLEQLWLRIAFSVCVSNTDDHLRNHGLLFTKEGFRLSPAYDLNPNAKGTGLTLNIDEHENRLSLDLVLSVAHFFRVNHTRAIELLDKIKESVNQWESLADEIMISRREKSEMASAFNVIKQKKT